jgi:uncharacterized protein YsxB (DUF464 family)
MVNAVFRHDGDVVTRVSVTGHANHGRHGTDIVCAAVSASVLMTANAIHHLNLDKTVSMMVAAGDFHLDVITTGKVTQGLLQTLEDAISQLADTYPKHITYRKED